MALRLSGLSVPKADSPLGWQKATLCPTLSPSQVSTFHTALGALRAAPRALLPFAEIGRRWELLICAILPRGGWGWGWGCEVGPLGKEG